MKSRIIAFAISVLVSQSQAAANAVIPLSESECVTDLEEVCFIHSPLSVEEVYYSRLCLWKNQDTISSNCVTYLTETSPSIVEPCFNEIESFCTGIIPGYGQVHNCLSSRAEDLTVRCANSLIEDNLRSSERTIAEDSSNVITMTFTTDAFTFTKSNLYKIYEDLIYSLFFPVDDSSSMNSQAKSSVLDIYVSRVNPEDVTSSSVTSGDADLDMFSGDDKAFILDSEIVQSSSSTPPATTSYGFARWSPFNSILSDYFSSHKEDTASADSKLAVSLEDLDQSVAETHSSLAFDDETKTKSLLTVGASISNNLRRSFSG
jgi:hypothetical protein